MKQIEGTPNEGTRRLLTWFAAHRRRLPWRKEPRDPYHVWVSEVMLQQTQVRTVIDYFNRWMDRFPSIPALAEAPLEAVLKAWEGLGYYSRARNLHKAARILVADFDGKLPRSARELQRLPGIGPYTAAAIASLAFGEDWVAVDGNIRRVASRLFAAKEDLPRKEVERLLAPLFPPGEAGRVNEALMELGALCCTPVSPACDDCPLRSFCGAFEEGNPEDYPVSKRKKKIPHVRRKGLLILGEGGLYLKRRPEEGMLGGLWGVPLLEDREAPFSLSGGTVLNEVSHAYTHFRITVTPIVVKEGGLEYKPGNGRFVPFDEIPHLALSTLDHKILERLRPLLSTPSGTGKIERKDDLIDKEWQKD